MSKNQKNLSEAVFDEDIKKMRKILGQGIDINKQDEYGFTILHGAVRKNSYEIVKLLLSQKHIDVHLKTKNDGFIPLHCACIVPVYTEIVKILIQKDQFQLNVIDNDGKLPLYYACLNKRLDLVKLLIENGTNVHYIDNDGYTALHHAANLQDFNTINYLLDNTSIDPRIKSAFDQTALYILLFQYNPSAISRIEEAQRQVIRKLVEKTFEADHYEFEDFFKVTVLACTKSVLESYFIHKFYSHNNGKYHLIERLEKFSLCQRTHYLKAFIHDRVTKDLIQEYLEVNLTLPHNEHYELIEKAITSDEINDLVLELFEHFNSIGFYDSNISRIMKIDDTFDFKCFGDRFHYEIGKYLLPKLAENLTSKGACLRMYKIMKCLNKNLSIDLVLDSFLERSLYYLQEFQVELLKRTIPILLPFTTNISPIIDKFIEKANNHELVVDLNLHEFIQELLQNYGDTRESGRIEGFYLKLFSLEHLCRDNIRRHLLKVSKSHSDFYDNLDILGSEGYCPKKFVAYLKFDEVYGLK